MKYPRSLLPHLLNGAIPVTGMDIHCPDGILQHPNPETSFKSVQYCHEHTIISGQPANEQAMNA